MRCRRWFKNFLVPHVTGSEVEAGNFTTVAYSVSFNVGKSVLKIMQTLRKNNLIIAKDVLTIQVNFTVIAITFSEKPGGITFVPPLVFGRASACFRGFAFIIL
jgi:hypothetical protein